MVVDPLGHLEEGRIALDDDPARVDAHAAHVREERLEQLGDAPAGGRGVHVDDPTTGEAGARGCGRVPEPGGALRADELLEAVRIERLDLDLVQHPDLPGRPRPGRRRRWQYP